MNEIRDQKRDGGDRPGHGPGEHDTHRHGRDGHDHDHDHTGHTHLSGGHSHAPADFGLAFAIGFALNAGFVIVEFGYGYLSHSVALMADAGHNLADVLGLVVAWVASVLAKRPPSQRYTYGLQGSTIIAALFNAVILLVAVGMILLETFRRFVQPEPVAAATVMVVAAIGIVVNGITAWFFASGSKGDLNLRGVFLHMLSDALLSAGVVVAGGVILLTNWLWLDPLVSLVINALIIWGTWGLLRGSLDMSLAAVPPGVDPASVQAFLEARPGVAEVHDLHIWSMSTTKVALTCHLVMPDGHPGDRFISELCKTLEERFAIGHPTVQIEMGGDLVCSFAPPTVI